MKIFSSARFQLTAWYTLTITIVSLLFSLGIYRVQTAELTRFESLQRERIESRLNSFGIMRGPMALILDTELIAEAKSRLLTRLGLVNGIIVVFSAGFGYFLAGRTLTPIQAMVEEQRRFIGDAGHELRTPLTALKTSLEVFLRDRRATPTSARSLIKDNLDEVKRLENLTTSLLALSGPDHPLPLEPLDLKPIISTCLKQLAPLAKRKNITLSSRLQSATIKGNDNQLLQLFTILLDNALKYTPPGGKVALTMTKGGKHFTVKLKDTGIGIKKSDLSHIFDRFYRADSARSRGGESGGYGLGLSIAKSIIKAHHGHIRVSSQPQKGTVFTLTFPVFS